MFSPDIMFKIETLQIFCKLIEVQAPSSITCDFLVGMDTRTTYYDSDKLDVVTIQCAGIFYRYSLWHIRKSLTVQNKMIYKDVQLVQWENHLMVCRQTVSVFNKSIENVTKTVKYKEKD